MARKRQTGDEIVQLAEIKETVDREIHDHEVMIAFNGDSHALMFREWLDQEGWDKFAKWASDNVGDYE